MDVSGKVLKASIVRGRDSTELLLRMEIRSGEFDPLIQTSDYVGQFGEVSLESVPEGYWDDAVQPGLDAGAEESANGVARVGIVAARDGKLREMTLEELGELDDTSVSTALTTGDIDATATRE